MKGFKVFRIVVLILVLFYIAHSQEQKKKAETADDLLIKFIEYLDKKYEIMAISYLEEAIEIDPTKRFYIDLLRDINNGKYAESLKRLEERKVQSSTEKESRVIQFLVATIHFRWAEALFEKNDYLNAIKHYELAYEIDKINSLSSSAIDLNNIGLVYDFLDQKQEAIKYYETALSILREVGDRSGEVTTLNNIGYVYFALGQKKKALEYYEKASPISLEVGDRSGESTTLNNIGMIYFSFGQNQKALQYYEEALAIVRNVGDLSGEANIMDNIGLVYFSLCQNQKALEYFEKALPILRKVGNRSGEATTLNNIGPVYSALGQKKKALEYYEKALPIFREVGNRSGEATTLNNIGDVYSDLGQYHNALVYLEKALPILREVKNHSMEAATLNNIGIIYDAFGQSQKALKYYHNALPIFRELGERNNEAIILNNIGKVYSEFGQNQKALKYNEKALPISQEVGNRYIEAGNLNNIGVEYFNLSQNQKSLEYYEKALCISREVGDRSGEAFILNNILGVYSNFDLYHKSLAIFYGKQAVNTIQNLRQDNENLNSIAKQKYLQSKEDIYRNTASFTIDSGRISEAQQVLDILKLDEYDSYIRRDRSAYTPQYSPIDYTGFEQKWIDWQKVVMEKLSSISKPYHELLIKSNKVPEEAKKLEALKVDLEKSQKEYSDFLALMKAEFEKHEKEKDPDIEALSKKSSVLKELLLAIDRESNGKNVALHFLIFKGQISVIITTPTLQTVKQSATFDEKEFNRVIYDYREVIAKLKGFPRGLRLLPSTGGQIEKLIMQKKDIETKLYNLIFLPAAQYLKQYGAINLLVSLDGVLRYIPLSSLYDGEHYLIQKYRFVLLTPSSLKHIDKKFINEMKILGMGAGKGGNGFAPLPFVNREIRAIVNDTKKGCLGIIKGHALIDDEFSRRAMVRRLKTTGYPFVHIASHFNFSPGDETKTKLLLGDGTIMSLSDIRKEGKLFNKVNLMVLSACQTGTGGNGEEIDGFGELAQQCGASCVIASLWSVDDESTKDLMVNFYRILKEGKVTSKIEALRQSQLQLAGLEDLLNKNNLQTKKIVSQNKKYSNPYFWGPFIMMGNWR